ncbi:MAG: hypothetical protein CFE27_10045 [Alphaproteobacteria bacterium PA1]|nr:MAG: hypothetical protein CFE27_10045 [Alphaproteobacteria bacterium PA1]
MLIDKTSEVHGYELNDEEVRLVNGAFGVPGAAIGAAVGGMAGGYNYIANHAGANNGTGATAGGFLASVGSGLLGGAVAGGTGSWIGGVAGAGIGVAGSYASGRFDRAR